MCRGKASHLPRKACDGPNDVSESVCCTPLVGGLFLARISSYSASRQESYVSGESSKNGRDVQEGDNVIL